MKTSKEELEYEKIKIESEYKKVLKTQTKIKYSVILSIIVIINIIIQIISIC